MSKPIEFDENDHPSREPQIEVEVNECPRGHEQLGSGEAILRRAGRDDVNSGPICIECQVTALGELYPTAPAADVGVK